ncbi:hypothetical protein PAL_GLEAN10009988 [Pteropus alecto]|uniref:Uncharacterized protein n=1 Tax=Pteropus alecto TaxID=9402 RepID=L5KAN5_PTEAL|nr:hypothetical protein PAL_GLEAN10009988 [Pteropus alecto]
MPMTFSFVWWGHNGLHTECNRVWKVSSLGVPGSDATGFGKIRAFSLLTSRRRCFQGHRPARHEGHFRRGPAKLPAVRRLADPSAGVAKIQLRRHLLDTPRRCKALPGKERSHCSVDHSSPLPGKHQANSSSVGLGFLATSSEISLTDTPPPPPPLPEKKPFNFYSCIAVTFVL